VRLCKALDCGRCGCKGEASGSIALLLYAMLLCVDLWAVRARKEAKEGHDHPSHATSKSQKRAGSHTKACSRGNARPFAPVVLLYPPGSHLLPPTGGVILDLTWRLDLFGKALERQSP
jgi:hypothetical protein